MVLVIEYSTARSDVRRWPLDDEAKRALEHFFDSVDAGSDTLPILAGDGLDFTGADLSGLDLAAAALNSALLSDTTLHGTCLVNAWILDAKLERADLSGANLRRARLRRCDCRGATLVGAQLNKTDISDGDFREVDLHSTALDQAFMPGIDLRGADLRSSSWGLAPSNAIIDEAKLVGANLSGMTGDVTDAVDVGLHEPEILRGARLQQWFDNHGAPHVRVSTHHE
ncbi:pentapeptide repeat-containing protein [Rhodococcoides yunnanense]|uniref:pentapeptide repeat-containing protein n=1 Tax=Rhodococcoides yunnanense TaxID=278209 RepID=UPI000934AF40|nr:pentapeptide repeat-containing protein [Rhodococcus yunnanensis]